MAILVTGATGFTGSSLCQRLCDTGKSVVAFVRESSEVSRLQEWGVECRSLDITHAESVRQHFEPFEVVYHIAAAYRAEHADKKDFWRVNVNATRHLLEAAREFGVGRFVHCSTVGVQGEIEDPPAAESYRYKPGDHYQESKLEGEKLALEYFANGVPGTVVRPVGIYGPGDRRFLKLFRSISRGKFVMIGRGQPYYHMTYIDDLIDGFLLAAERPEALGEVFTIAGERYTTLRELVHEVAAVVGRKPPRIRIPYTPVLWASVVCEKLSRLLGVNPVLFPRRVEFFHLSRAFSIEKARAMLGYRPRVGLTEGLGRTAEWYRSVQWL